MSTARPLARISSRPPGPMRAFPRPTPVPTVVTRTLGLIAGLPLIAAGAGLASTAAGDHLDGAAFARALGMYGVFAIALLAVAGRTIARLEPLHRALQRSHERSEAIPPSRAALEDAYVAPRYAFFACVVAGAVSAAFALIGMVDGGDARSGCGIALASLGAGLLVAPLFAWGVARLGRVWIDGFDAEDAALPDRAGAERSLTLHAASLSLAPALLGAAAVVLRGAPLGVCVALFGIGLMPAIACVLIVSRRVAALQLEIDALTAAAAALEATPQSEERRRLGLSPEDPRLAALATELDRFTVAIDTSSRKEDAARLAVEELQAAKMRFMASQSHDLRSPLNAILGFCELMRMGHDGDLNAAQKESLALVERSGGELLALLNDILDSARFAAGRLKLHREWTPSVEILTEAVRRGRDLASGKNLDVDAVLEPGLPAVFVDRERIVQAVTGLFRHAARAMDRGTIRMYARVARGREGAPDHVHVDVVDSGGGIRADDRERLFMAFQSVTSASGRRIDGVGLTLSLVRDLAEAHGGKIWFESEGGKGTRFTVSVPVEAAAERPVRAEER